MTIPSVALMGLAISDAQIQLLLEGGIRSVIVILDGDDEGRVALGTVLAKLSSHFFTRSIHLPNDQKPDDCDMEILNAVKLLCTGKQVSVPIGSPDKNAIEGSSPDDIDCKGSDCFESALPVSSLAGASIGGSATGRMNWNGIDYC